MVHEIADSDEETEFLPLASRRSDETRKIAARASNSDTEAVLQPEADASEDHPDPLLSIDFDELCTPTQRLSSFDNRDDIHDDPQTSDVLNSSTKRFLNDVAVGSQASATSAKNGPDMGGKGDERVSVKSRLSTKKKRSRLQADEVESSNNSGAKRSKTYGSSGVPKHTSDASRAFKALINGLDGSCEQSDGQKEYAVNKTTIDPTDLVSVEARTQYTSPLDISLHLSATDDNPVHGTSESYRKMNSPSYAPHQPYSHNPGFLNWQGGTTSNSSIGNYQSFTINPGQLGMGYNDINPFGRLSQASFVAEDDADTNAIAKIFRNSGRQPMKEHAKDDLLKVAQDMATSPIQNNGIDDPPEELVAHELPPQGSPSFSPITNPDDHGGQAENQIPARALDEVMEPSVEVLPETIEVPRKPVPKKRGRKPKKKPAEVDHENDVDELALDDSMIARRLRAGTVDSVSNASEISHASSTTKQGGKRNGKKKALAKPEELPKKLPSSDLGLDNKEIIGLSPERYKPKPSRSRRGKIEPEIVKVPVLEDLEERSDSQNSDEELLPPTTTPARAKKGKIAKAKSAEGAKTKPVIISEEGDEIEEIDGVGEQAAKEMIDIVDVDQNDDSPVKLTSRSTKISVDVPALLKSEEYAELPPSLPEPKKRGRKRRKPTEDSIEFKEEEAGCEDPQVLRPALALKDANIQLAEAEESSKFDVQAEKELAAVVEEDKEIVAAVHKIEFLTSPAKSATPKSQTATVAPSLSTPLSNTRARVGLSKHHNIPSLLRRVDREKEAPKIVEKKEKLNKRQLEEKEQERIAREEAEAEGREYVPLDIMRDKDGRLIEWDF